MNSVSWPLLVDLIQNGGIASPTSTKILSQPLTIRRTEKTPMQLANAICIALATLVSALVGCAGYRIGPSTLYRQDIRTVHVPIVRCDSFRASLGVEFTEILQKRIEDRTTFKLADLTSADSQFVCRIVSDSKRVVTETTTDEPRDLMVGMSIETNWTDRFGNVLMQNRFLPPGETAFFFSEQAHLVPEGGQSITTSHLKAMERLADSIVDQMEVRW